MLQRLPIALAQVKSGNNLDNMLILCINQKKLIKKLYKSIIKSE